ncbi:CDP-2,3-bis-(O-geranylgeranyl)-sn-glycerol synthase [Halomarina pelagica]|uniref:CDP-2,3-bis-(O-geranylgeranyl)-sn-glycerol synthase n=1 Tax=Halomarina pelagica TaxID=2961599 RepID=UPI0020C4DE2D|nr:CDP-2,3-bis-(O-geranylgeranyl)-sn-glycerol synthase [Halomarina sp. BND7]
MLEAVARAVWAMLPAYVPNNAAVLFGGGRPIDGGRTWNGKRLLGDGKTWRGTAVGTLAGALLSLLLNRVAGRVEGRTGWSLPRFSLRTGLALAFGAMLGDIAGSFYKRRTGLARGQMALGLDQLDFVAGALGLARLLAPRWFDRTFTRPTVAVVLLLTPLLHVVANAVAYLWGLKDEPY